MSLQGKDYGCSIKIYHKIKMDGWKRLQKNPKNVKDRIHAFLIIYVLLNPFDIFILSLPPLAAICEGLLTAMFRGGSLHSEAQNVRMTVCRGTFSKSSTTLSAINIISCRLCCYIKSGSNLPSLLMHAASQADRQSDRQKDRQTDRQTDRQCLDFFPAVCPFLHPPSMLFPCLEGLFIAVCEIDRFIFAIRNQCSSLLDLAPYSQ